MSKPRQSTHAWNDYAHKGHCQTDIKSNLQHDESENQSSKISFLYMSHGND